ncbi:MAG: hypothetical protein P1V51_23545 [Deltaproteobacteria bacterium]|nr:hypothetical protein [Deltaproteobacteria bacterium]
MTPASQQALEVLRSTENFQWYVIPLFVFVIYVYVAEIAARNWSAVQLGAGMWAAELMAEQVNALILTATGRSALWTTPGDSAYVIYAGLNIEIAFMFMISGLMIVKLLPGDRDLKILGVPNRLFIPLAFGLLACTVEVLLNFAGVLVWEYAFWSWPHVYLVLFVYTAPWMLLVRVHDRWSPRAKQRAALLLPAAAILSHLIFATGLGWI